MKANIKSCSTKATVSVTRDSVINVDASVAYVVLPLLLEYKARLNSFPAQFTAGIGSRHSDRNYCFDFIDSDENEVFAIQKWNDNIDKMIWAFYQLVDQDYESKYQHGDWSNSLIWDPIDPVTGLGSVRTNPESNCWIDKTGQQIHEERIQEGLDLFATHLRTLWL